MNAEQQIELTTAERSFLREYARLASGRRFYSPTLQQLADAIGCSKSYAFLLSRQLATKGYVDIHPESSRSVELRRLEDGTEVQPWYA